MRYGEIISQAVGITWRNKFLWFFGFFAGVGGSFNFPGGGGNAGGPGGGPGGLPGPLSDVGRWISDNLALFLTVTITLVVVIGLVLIALSIISQAALTDSVAAIDRGERRRFGSTWRAGTANFWRVLGLKILLLLISLALGLALALVIGLPTAGVFVVTESVGARVVAVVLAVLAAIALLILVFVPFAVISQWALRRLVLDRERIVASIGGGIGLFRRNIGRSLLVWLIQLGLMLGAGILMIVVLIIFGLVLVGPAFLLANADYTAAAVAVGAVGGVVLLAIFLVLSSVLGTFNSSYWTLAYLRLTNPAAPETAA